MGEGRSAQRGWVWWVLGSPPGSGSLLRAGPWGWSGSCQADVDTASRGPLLLLGIRIPGEVGGQLSNLKIQMTAHPSPLNPPKDLLHVEQNSDSSSVLCDPSPACVHCGAPAVPYAHCTLATLALGWRLLEKVKCLPISGPLHCSSLCLECSFQGVSRAVSSTSLQNTHIPEEPLARTCLK